VFSSLEKHQVKYLVIGGIASILYGVPRATFDLDITIEPTKANAEKLLRAFEEARIGTASLISAEDLVAHEITIFKDYVRIDVQTKTPGINFIESWEHRETMDYGGQKFFVVSKEDLITSKRSAGRKVDIEDVTLLELEDED
jgi:predicted nucleotidyltransferase